MSASEIGMSHAAAWELLPWYVNDTLDRDERRAVHAHLLGCAECRQEEARCRETMAAVRAGGAAPSPHPAGLARLLERLEEPAAPREGPLRAILAAPLGVRVALAAQAAALVALLVVIFWPATPVAFRTLEAPAAVAPARAQVRVVFAPEATESEIRALLLQVGGEITGGPSPLGAYTVTVPDREGTSEPLPVVLAYLRGHARVRFAEPVAGGGGG
jgi:anti-sigma factor RsiW